MKGSQDTAGITFERIQEKTEAPSGGEDASLTKIQNKLPAQTGRASLREEARNRMGIPSRLRILFENSRVM
jgi:hypothetical protein